MRRRFESKFEKVVGGTKKEKTQAKEKLQDWFEDFHKEEFAPYENPKSEKEKRIIQHVESSVENIIKTYEGEYKSLPEEKIHVVKPSAVEVITKGESKEACHFILSQDVAVERTWSDVDFATRVAHELFHLNSYKSARLAEGKIEPCRSGISMFDKEKVKYFGEIEEAIISELTRQFYQNEIKGNPLYQEEVEATEKVKWWIRKFTKMKGAKKEKQEMIFSEIHSIPKAKDILKILESNKSKKYKHGFLVGAMESLIEKDKVIFAERFRERKKFDKLLEEILIKSSGRFKNKQEIFSEFAKANFSGNLPPLAKIIRESLGKGVFQRVAKEFKE